MRAIFRAAIKRNIVANAIKISFVVGTVLNVINQGDVVMHGGPPSWLHVALNYLVPYCVASYSAAINELSGGK